MTDPTDEMLAATLRILRSAKDNRCAVAAIKWRIGIAERDDAEQLMLAIREELTSHRLIGWSFPPNGPAELFLSDFGKQWLADLKTESV